MVLTETTTLSFTPTLPPVYVTFLEAVLAQNRVGNTHITAGDIHSTGKYIVCGILEATSTLCFVQSVFLRRGKGAGVSRRECTGSLGESVTSSRIPPKTLTCFELVSGELPRWVTSNSMISQ